MKTSKPRIAKPSKPIPMTALEFNVMPMWIRWKENAAIYFVLGIAKDGLVILYQGSNTKHRGFSMLTFEDAASHQCEYCEDLQGDWKPMWHEPKRRQGVG